MDMGDNSGEILVTTLLKSTSARGELKALQNLFTKLDKVSTKLSTVVSAHEDEFLDDDLLPIDKMGMNYNTTVVDLLEFCGSQDQLNKFTCYVFERRYGWSEANTDLGGRVRRVSCTGTVLESSDGQQKALINEILDSIIKWYNQKELSLALAEAFHYTLKQVSNLPVVRNRTVVHVMDWLKDCREELADFLHSSIILDLVCLSLMDVWSAIRSTCAKHLTNIVAYFSSQDKEQLFNRLVKVCRCENSSWQAKEGAIMGINAIVHQLPDATNSRSHTPLFTLDTESQMTTPDKQSPDYITSQIHSVVFSLLSNPQLSIRENAAKALSTFVSCSGIEEAISTFEKVMLQLKNGVVFTKGNSTDNNHTTKVQFMDAFVAEGILNVCLSLVKVLALSNLLPKWPQYSSTLLLYLSHPASTVRQTTSNVFKHLVAKSSHCAVLVKLLVQTLAGGWDPDVEALRREGRKGDTAQMPRPSIHDVTGGGLIDAWESREGRLLTYELIFKFLIKNHWLYTFGPAGSSTSIDWDQPENPGTCNGKGSPNIQHNNTEVMLSSTSAKDPAFVQSSDSELNFAVKFATHDVGLTSNRDSWERLQNKNIQSENAPSAVENVYSVLMQMKWIEKHGENGKLKSMEKLLSHLPVNHSDGAAVQEWYKQQEQKEFGDTLVKIFLQTSDGLSEANWELRRMAQQVFPCLAEVIRWFDVSLLNKILQTYLTDKTSLGTYTTSLLLKESVTHCVKLQGLLQRPPSTWQDPELCGRIISAIITGISHHLPSYLPFLDTLLQRPTYSRMSIVAASTIVIAHNHFSIPADQRLSQTATLLSFWKMVFSFTHPNSKITKELLHGNTDIRMFHSPFEGYLSCCLVKPENKLQCAKQVEKLFVMETYSYIKQYLLSLPVESSSFFLPILAHYSGLFIQDSHVCKSLCECLNSLGSRVVDGTFGSHNDELKQNCLKCINFSLKELSAVITMKSSEVPLVQKVLNIYISLCRVINPAKHVPNILVAICSRINDDIFFSAEHSPRPGDDLTLLSNDIPLSSSPTDLLLGEPEDVVMGSPGVFAECMTLDLSNGSLPSGRLSALSQYSEKGSIKSPSDQDVKDDAETDSSDWDSWDEEVDEGHSALREALSQFLHKLKKLCKTDKRDIFTQEVNKLGRKEKALILELMENT